MTYITIVHIADVPSEVEQRCVRCHEVLIEAKGAMSLDCAGMRTWEPGSFVGISSVPPAVSFKMPRDAEGDDEVACMDLETFDL